MNDISKKSLSLLILSLFILILLTCEKDRFTGNFEPKYVERYQNSMRVAKKEYEVKRLKEKSELESRLKQTEEQRVAIEDELKAQAEQIIIKGYEEEPDADHVIITGYKHENGKYFFDLRGDFWFLGTATPTLYLVSTGQKLPLSNIMLYRSSYNAIAPYYDRYGNSLLFGTFPEYWGRGYNIDFYYATRDIDDALYLYETGTWTFTQARQHMLGSLFLGNICLINKSVKDLHGLLQRNAIDSVKEFAYGVLDLINMQRWGCPAGVRTGICYGGQ